MMVMNVFPRQALIGNPASAGVYQSEIFDTTQYASLDLQTRIYGISAASTTITVKFWCTTDPTLDKWTSMLTLSPTDAAVDKRGVISDPLNFLRCEISVPATKQVVIECCGICRDSS